MVKSCVSSGFDWLLPSSLQLAPAPAHSTPGAIFFMIRLPR